MREAGIGPGDLALDLGAGSGRITAALAAVARHVVAVELDARWAAKLRGRWPNVDVVERDAGELALPREPFRVVANLPFHRTADLLHALLDDPRTRMVRADLVVEWGVAVKRSLPWPSSLNGVIWGASYEARLARRLPRACFTPPPSVDAGVLVFIRRAAPLVDPALADRYRSFVATGFRHGPRAVASKRALLRVHACGATARDLDAHQWADLFRYANGRR